MRRFQVWTFRLGDSYGQDAGQVVAYTAPQSGPGCVIFEFYAKNRDQAVRVGIKLRKAKDLAAAA